MKNIIECIPGAATPMNTLGMGTVEPCGTDPIPFRSFKRKKSRKRRMKHLKDIINEKLKVTTNKVNSNILECIWDVTDFKSFYRFFKFTDNFGSYAQINADDYKITEYCFGYHGIHGDDDIGEFDGLGDIIKSIKNLRPIRFDNSTYQDVFGDIDNTGHIDAFIYRGPLNKPCLIIETFTEGLCFYNVFSLDKNLVDEIIDYLPDDLTPIDAYSLKEQTTVELDFLK
jgi:hypothetical protein